MKNHKRILFVLIALLSFSFSGTAGLSGAETKPSSEKPKVFTEKGVFSIPVPEEGFAWKKSQSMKAGNIPTDIYLCTKPESEYRTVLTVKGIEAKEDEVRVAMLKGEFNGLYNTFQKAGLKFIETKQPNVTPPIPKNVEFAFHLQNPEGKDVFVQGQTIFGKKIYTIMVMTPDKKETEKILKTLHEGFREGGAEKKKATPEKKKSAPTKSGK